MMRSASRAALISASRWIPVSIPSSWQMIPMSAVKILPTAPTCSWPASGQPHAHMEGDMDIGTADAAFDLLGMSPAHGVGQIHRWQRHAPVGAGIDQPADLIGHGQQRYGVTQIATNNIGLFLWNAQGDVAGAGDAWQ